MTRDDEWLTALFERERWQLSPKPGEVERILTEVAHRRRRRLILRSVAAVTAAATVIGAGALAAAIQKGASSGDGLAGPSRQTGPIPEAKIIKVRSVDELARVIPGTTVRELSYRTADSPGEAGGRIVPAGVSDSGQLIAMVTPTGGTAEIVKLDPTTGEGITLGKAKLPNLTSASVWGSTVVWAEAANGPDDPETGDVKRVHRCTVGGSHRVHDLALPKQDRTGDEYSFAATKIGAGRIVAEMSRPTFVSLADMSDLYVAATCGAKFKLLAEHAYSPQVVDDWIYYIQDGAVQRRDIRTLSAPEVVVARASTFQVTADALVWTDAAGSVLTTFYVARLDGSQDRAVPVPEDWRFPDEANAEAVAGEIEKAQGFKTVRTGIWIYLPSSGAIVVLDRPEIPIPERGGQPEAAIGLGGGAAGDYLLLAEYGSALVGSSVAGTDPSHQWLVKLP